MEIQDELTNDIHQKSRFLNEDTPKTDPFPVNVFPSEIQEVIASGCEGLNLPVDFFAGAILYTISIAIGNSCRIEIKPGWSESAAIWLSLVGNSGTNKSHPLSLALTPIFEKQTKVFNEYEAALQEYDDWLQKPKSEREKGYSSPIKPILKKYILSDYTPEALVFHHQKNLRGVGIYSDELHGWLNNFNRYNKGNEEQFWLSAWSGKPIITDRRGSGSFHVKLPFVSVGGTIQTALIKELAKGTKGKNGFVERLLFIFPDNLKKSPWSDSSWQKNHRTIYNNAIEKILEVETGIEDVGVISPKIFPLSPSAKKLLWEWQATNTEKCNSTDDDQKKAIYAKLEIYATRFSLILRQINWALGKIDEDVIDANSVTGGIILAEYFRKNALKVLHILNSSSPVDSLPKDKRYFYTKVLPEKFETSEANKLAEEHRISLSTLKRLLAERRLFEKDSHGKYSKIY